MHHFNGASLYRTDYFSLLACMVTGHFLADNPFYGASLYFLAGIARSFPLYGRMAACTLCGICIALACTLISVHQGAGRVVLFVLALTARDMARREQLPLSRGVRSGRPVFLAHLVLDAVAMLSVYSMMPREGFYLVSALILVTGYAGLSSSVRGPAPGFRLPKIPFMDVSSYRLFSGMRFCAVVGANLGTLAFLLALMPWNRLQEGGLGHYVLASGLLALMLAAYIPVSFSLWRRTRGSGLPYFSAGVMLCIAACLIMPRPLSLWGVSAWLVLWVWGISLASSGIRCFELDFAAVGRIAGPGHGPKELSLSNAATATAASAGSSSAMFVLTALFAFLLPSFGYASLRWLTLLVCGLSLAFMAGSALFALREPLDVRCREKLILYDKGGGGRNARIEESMRNVLVRPHKANSGVRILSAMAKLFLRLRVCGAENLRPGNYPSVFVCNHGFVYGPVSAVVYLPTYFRPWIHDVMLDRGRAETQLHKSMHKLVRLFGKRAGGALIHAVAGIVCRVLGSFNPVPVVRGASRDVMNTLQVSLDALLDGDNVLIFPEKPRELATNLPRDGAYDPMVLRNFYTGFAHVGKMYHDATGKNLLFYPVFSDKRRRLFIIGSPVAYDPSLGPRESKARLAGCLQERMSELGKWS